MIDVKFKEKKGWIQQPKVDIVPSKGVYLRQRLYTDTLVKEDPFCKWSLSIWNRSKTKNKCLKSSDI